MAAGDTNTSVIRVFSYEPGTKVSKQKGTLQFAVPDQSDDRLEIIRELLLKEKVLGALDARAPFCDEFGAEVSDQMTIGVYLGQLTNEEEQEAEGDESLDAETRTSTKQEGKIPKFYYKKKKVQTKTDDMTQEFLKKKLDLKLRESKKLSPMRAQLLQSAFQGNQWTAAPAAKLSVVAELTERDWSMIVRTNCLLSGQELRSSKGLKEPEIVRTPFNAFKIKSREFDSYEIVAPTTTAVYKKGVSTDIEIGKLRSHIPRFRVDDSSYVTVIETQDSFQSSMAKSSFDQMSIEASAGGGFWGVSAAVKGGLATSKSESGGSANSQEQKKLHVVYNFPRVSVYLDANSLELTEAVKEDIQHVISVGTSASVEEFGNKYGHVFSRRVKLGGRLISTHQSLATTEEEQLESENSLKAAAAVSVSGYGFSASAEASHEKGEQKSNDKKKQNFSSNMSWEATGGNTVLCNDPPQWCGTVGDFRHWRIVEQGDIVPLTKLISTFEGFETTEKAFHKIAGTDVLLQGRHVRNKIQLIDMNSKQTLIGLPAGVNSPLKTAMEKISDLGGFGPLTRSALQDDLMKVKHGGVKLGDSEHTDNNALYWVLERWVPRGQSEKLSYGVKNFIRYGSKGPYLGLTRALPHSPNYGFLYMGDEKDRGLFILERPGQSWKGGPVEDEGTVVLRIRNSWDTQEKGYVMKGTFNGDDKTISAEIDQVPAFGPIRSPIGTDNRERILKFKVKIIESWVV